MVLGRAEAEDVLQVGGATLLLVGGSTPASQILSAGFHGVSIKLNKESGTLSAVLHVFDVEVQDLCSDGPGVSSALLGRWDKGDPCIAPSVLEKMPSSDAVSLSLAGFMKSLVCVHSCLFCFVSHASLTVHGHSAGGTSAGGQPLLSARGPMLSVTIVERKNVKSETGKVTHNML